MGLFDVFGWGWNTVFFVIGFVVTVYLSMRSGSRYSVRDSVTHATDYASTIKEAHGPLTWFLWVSYIVILIWTVLYLWEHSSEFAELPWFG